MSLDMNVYLPEIDNSIIPRLLEVINQLDMTCEAHPEFALDDASGFVPFKIRLKNSTHEKLNNSDFYAGFELYIDDFNYEKEIEELKPKKSLLKSLLKKKQEQVYFANEEIDKKLSNCKKALYFVGRASDTFDFRMTLLFSAVISKLSNGLCCYPADELWYNNETIIEDISKEVVEYEESLNEEDLAVLEFKGWL